MSLIIFLIVGFIAGLIARALVPGKQPMGFVATLLLGIIGSFLGGLITSAASGGPILQLHRGGIIMSIVGAFIVLFIWTSIQKRRNVTV